MKKKSLKEHASAFGLMYGFVGAGIMILMIILLGITGIFKAIGAAIFWGFIISVPLYAGNIYLNNATSKSDEA